MAKHNQAPIPSPPSPGVLPSRKDDATGLLSWMPGLYTLLNYRRQWLRHDLAAGLVLTTVLIPIGIGYSVAAGLPGIYGLYATIIPLLVYAIFGPSRLMVIGPDSALAGIIFAIIVPMAAGNPERLITLASTLAIFSGLIIILVSLLKLGFITELISKPIRYGYMNGIALTVLVGQTPALIGISTDASDIFAKLQAIWLSLLKTETNKLSLLIGLASLILLLIIKRFRRFPGPLVVLTLATIVVAYFELDRHGVTILGNLPGGLPSFTIPVISYDDLIPLLLGAGAIALLSSSQTSILSRTYAAKYNRYINPNKEFFGLGIANLFTGFFQGFPISSSASRTPVSEAAGSKTQLACITGAIIVGSLLLWAPDLLYFLPAPTLAAVVITSIISIFEFKDLKRIYRIQPWEFWLSMVCFAGVAVFGVLPGIGIAVAIAILEYLWNGWRPHYAILGRVDHLKGYHDISRHPTARLIPGLILLRWDAPLFFANAELFHHCVLDSIAKSPHPVRRIVITSEPVTSVDVTSADMLVELDEQLKAAGIELCFAEMKDPVRDKLRKFGLSDRFDNDRLFPTIGQAVNGYLNAYIVEWIDWEDRV